MNYTVEFSLEAADTVRRRLESDPVGEGTFLAEGVYFADEEPLRAFFFLDAESRVVEITDSRML